MKLRRLAGKFSQCRSHWVWRASGNYVSGCDYPRLRDVRTTVSFMIETHKQEEALMTIDKAVMRFAGSVVLVSLALGHYYSANWYWLTAFVGANLLQSSFTGFCPLAMFLKKLGVSSGPAF